MGTAEGMWMQGVWALGSHSTQIFTPTTCGAVYKKSNSSEPGVSHLQHIHSAEYTVLNMEYK